MGNPGDRFSSDEAHICLTLCIQMDYPLHIDTISLELSVLYFKAA